jgi:DNA-binding IclR family transcriptional regulator
LPTLPISAIAADVLHHAEHGCSFRRLLRLLRIGQAPLATILTTLRSDGYLHQHLDTFSLTARGAKIVADEQQTKQRARRARHFKQRAGISSAERLQ